MECFSFIEHAVAVEHLVRQNELDTLSANCTDLDTTIKVSSGNLCYKNRSYIFPLQFVLGIAGNFLTICVFNRKSMRSLTNYFLSCIAVADIGFFLSLSMSSAIVFPKFRDSTNFMDLYYVLYPYLLMSANFFSALSLWSAAGATAQRFIAVRYPLKVRLIFNRYRLISASLSVCVLSIALSSFKVYQGNDILHTCELKPVRSDSTVLDFKAIWMLFLTLMVLVPIILVVVFNILMVFALRFSGQQLTHHIRRSRLASLKNLRKMKTERKVTLLVMVTTASCVMLNTPSLTISILKIVYGFRWLTTKPSLILPLSNILVATDKTLHFFFYCFFSSKFRRGLKSLISFHSYDDFKNSASSPVSFKLSESGFSASSTRGLHTNLAVNECMVELLSKRIETTNRQDEIEL